MLLEHNVIFCNESLAEIALRSEKRGKIINRRALLFYWALWCELGSALCGFLYIVWQSERNAFSLTFITVCHFHGARSCQNLPVHNRVILCNTQTIVAIAVLFESSPKQMSSPYFLLSIKSLPLSCQPFPEKDMAVKFLSALHTWLDFRKAKSNLFF